MGGRLLEEVGRHGVFVHGVAVLLHYLLELLDVPLLARTLVVLDRLKERVVE
jgi:hypothetical protein